MCFDHGLGAYNETLVLVDVETQRVDEDHAAVERARQRTVCAVMLVDRRCHAIARPYLYKRVYVGSWRAMQQLVARLEAANEMARDGVHALLVDVDLDGCIAGPVPGDELAHFASIRRDAEDLVRVRADAEVVARLLACVPRLRTLALAVGRRLEASHRPLSIPDGLRQLATAQSTPGNVRRLPARLRKLQIIVDHENMGATLDRDHHLHRLRELDITLSDSFEIGHPRNPTARFVRHCPRLRRLLLRRVMFSEVSAILGEWPGTELLELELQWGGDAFEWPHALPTSVASLILSPFSRRDAASRRLEASDCLGRCADAIVAGAHPPLRYLQISTNDNQVVSGEDAASMRSMCRRLGIVLCMDTPVRVQSWFRADGH